MPLTKNVNPTTPASPSALKSYVLAARPKTWIASISSVLIGTVMTPQIMTSTFILTLLFSLLIQIGTNFANDYFDFMNGADTAARIGPKRAVQQGWISPQSMLLATSLIFGLALLLAIPLIILAGLWSLPLATACIALGVLYTGGPKPLGYLGLGELLAFTFFGPVATCGAYFLQTHTVTPAVFLASLAPGALSCSLLIANNLRDELTDRAANKKTLIVRFGPTFGKWEYILSISLAAAIPIALVLFYHAPIPLLLASLIFFRKNPSLSETALLFFLYTAIFCLTIDL